VTASPALVQAVGSKPPSIAPVTVDTLVVVRDNNKFLVPAEPSASK